MPVYLRKRNLKGDRKRYYLDIYHDGQRCYENLDLFQEKARLPHQAKRNKENKELAEEIRATRQKELAADGYGLGGKFKQNINFLAYFEKFVQDYTNKDYRIVRYAFEHFKKFLDLKGFGKKITPKQVDETFCRQFQSYLKDNLNGETPFNYFTKFKKCLKQATKERVFISNPADEIKNTRTDGLKKDILDFNEIQRLYKSDCPNKEVKRAFLFCLNTGLRWCDVKKNLTWSNFDLTNKQVRLFQLKTDRELVIDLNSNALNLIGEKGNRDDLIFKLPSNVATTKSLRKWMSNAEVEKHITWHCARHSYAVNLLWMNNDIKTVSGLLGHSGLKHTEKYTRLVDELKKKAVNSLPVFLDN